MDDRSKVDLVPFDVDNSAPVQDEVRGSVFEVLYKILDNSLFNHKKAEGKDVTALNKLVTPQTRETFACVDIAKNMEKSCFSIVLTDVNDLSRLVAHASFTDTPTDPGIVIGGKRWRKTPELSQATPTNTLFMSVFVFREDEEMKSCLEEVLANTFCACESVEYIMLECPSVDWVGEGYIFCGGVTELLFKGKAGVMKKLIIYAKDVFLPKLRVRPGKKRDLDDLMALVDVELNDLEEMFAEKRTFLVNIKSMPERPKSTYVAEFQHRGLAVGVITVSTEVNCELLNEQFHLERFHGLCKPHDQDEVNLQSVESRLLGPLKRSDIRLRETYDKSEVGTAAREEKPSAGDLNAVDPRSFVSVSTVGGGGGDDDVLDFYMDLRSVSGTALPSRAAMTTGYSGDYLNIASQTSRQQFRRGPYRRESTRNRDFDHLDVTGQEELLAKVKAILDDLNQRGLTISDAMLDIAAIRVLTEAQAYINYCIYRYLHKTLIEDNLLPNVNWNQPLPSSFMGLPNAIILEHVSIDKKFSSRIIDLFNGVFAAHPLRDYLIVTTPISAPELPWMKFFVRVTPKQTNLLDAKSLYIMHRSCFSTSLRYRRANKKGDCEKIENLLEILCNCDAEKILNDFKQSMCSTHNLNDLQAFVAEATSLDCSPVVALAIIGPESKAGGYQVNYELDQYLYFDLHDPDDHAYVYHFIINPLFQPHSKIMMKEIMRMMNVDSFFHKIFPPAADPKHLRNQSELSNICDFVPLVPRRRVEYSLLNLSEAEDDLRQPPKSSRPSTVPVMAFHYSKKFTYEPKNVVSQRIVFIGASDTTLSCLARILSSPNCDFKNLTLISTHGLPGGLPTDEIRNLFFPRKNGPALSMRSNEEWYQCLPIRQLVTTVYGTAVRILRKIKVVVVDESKIVPYDLLVIATGRQFIRPDCPVPDIVDERLERFKRSLAKSTDVQPERIPIPPKPKNVFLINTDVDAAQALNLLRSFIPFVSNRQVIVHGACLEAYCCLRALIELGISPNRITFVTALDDEMAWEEFHPYRDTAQLRELMMATMVELGIEVLRNYDFRRWNLESDTGLCNRVYFTTIRRDMLDDRPIKVSVPCLAYFAYCTRRVGDDIVTAITPACLPYNNGIIINTRFETDDTNIMAAGPCAVYNKRLCAEKFDHFHFSSYEVGQKLGEFILKRVLPAERTYHISVLAPESVPFPPTLTRPLVHYADLPGSWRYLHVSRPGWVPHCCRQAECKCKECECGTEITTGSVKRFEDSEQKLFRLRLDKYQKVDGLECISRQKFPPSCLSSLYGHHTAFLNGLLDGLEKAEIDDLYKHFCKPWAAALGMDRWITFRNEIRELMSTYEIEKGLKIGDFVKDYIDNLENPEVFKVDPNILRHVFENTNLKAAIESKFLNFLKYNKAVLPMYARPDFVEETYNERIASQAYIPLHKNFEL